MSSSMYDGKQDFVIPVSYTVQGYISIRARTATHAIRLAHLNPNALPMLENPSIVPDSYWISKDETAIKLLTGMKANGDLDIPVTSIDPQSLLPNG